MCSTQCGVWDMSTIILYSLVPSLVCLTCPPSSCIVWYLAWYVHNMPTINSDSLVPSLVCLTCPPSTWIVWYPITTNHNLRSDNKILLPKCHTINVGLKSFAYQAGSLWNKLPNSFRTCESLKDCHLVN